MNVLSLFTGIGGLDLGLKIACPQARVVCCVEANGYCQRVLAARMSDGSLDACPIHGDVTRFDGRPWRGCVDLICGGFPCQDISNAGKREGIGGERSGLWREFERIIRQVGPRLVFVENVSALLVRGMDVVLGDLSLMGFDAQWGTVAAADVGASHLRRRVFILAYSRHHEPSERFLAAEGQQPRGRGEARGQSAPSGGAAAHAQRPEWRQNALPRGCRCEGQDGKRETAGGAGERSLSVADSGSERLERDGRAGATARPVGRGSGAVVGHAARHLWRASGNGQRDASDGSGDLPLFPPGPAERDAWAAILKEHPSLEPAVCRLADGLPDRVARLKALGNAVVPLQAAAAFSLLARRIGK